MRSKSSGLASTGDPGASRTGPAADAAAPPRPAAPPPRVVIEKITPQVNGGRFPARSIAGESVEVAADIFCEGHDVLVASLHHRRRGSPTWVQVPMLPVGADRWKASFPVPELGCYEYRVEGCVDAFETWRRALEKKAAAAMDVESELIEGAAMIRAVADRAGEDARWLSDRAALVEGPGVLADRVEGALDAELAERMVRHPDRSRATLSEPVLAVEVERPRAAFGAWYEMFPRSAAAQSGRHGTFDDVIARLPYVASMGFDVLYLPPIHPIGATNRKGPNNTVAASPGDVGSPWAIGSHEGGHDAVHPALGTIGDFDRVVEAARRHGLEIALDLALQCSPDHPWAREHPQWFRHRPDGSIQFAENPPKKYEDIFPLYFDNPDWKSLWQEIRRIVLFWVAHGVEIFRVDNPHTKPFAFWEWLIREVRARHPRVIFLSEAFTRARVMRYLAKCGFSQSYTYFTWRNTRQELTAYLTELTQTDVAEYLRPNLFANTPDIVHEYLQAGGRAAHQIRLVLAATLAASYGIYGPPYELCEARAIAGTEEYQDSEKYQLRHWDLDRSDSLAPLIARVNEIRNDNPAFRYPTLLRFLESDNDEIIAYTRSTPDHGNQVIVVVNLSPQHAHSAWLTLPLEELGLDHASPFQVHDLLSGARYLWHGERNFISIDPRVFPAQIFRVRRRLRTERDFDYYQ